MKRGPSLFHTSISVAGAALLATAIAFPVQAQKKTRVTIGVTETVGAYNPHSDSVALMYAVWCQVYGCLGNWNFQKAGNVGLLAESSDDDFSRLLNEICTIVDETIQNTRSLVFDLSSAALHEVGFEAAVEWLVDRIRDEKGIECEVQFDRQPKPLEDHVSVVLFQAVRELLINVGKHAKASQVVVSVRTAGDRIEIVVNDNGIGFDMSSTGDRKLEERGFGLFSIRERVLLLGGRVEIETTPGNGTRVALEAPLKSEKGAGNRAVENQLPSRKQPVSGEG